MAELPDSVKVSGAVYIIGEDNDFNKGARILGRVDHHSLEINIKTEGIASQVICESLVHEISHAINVAYIATDHLSEEQIEAFSNGLIQVLQDNPDVVAFLAGSKGPFKYAEKDELVREIAGSAPMDNVPWKDGVARCRFCSQKELEDHHLECFWKRARDLSENPG